MGFIHGALLWGIGAVSVPIVIHLLNRRRFQRVRWAAMEFLLSAQKKNKRRVRVEHLLVLLLRCLAMALLALAVSRPVATSGALLQLPGVGDPVERVVLLDDSGSMSHRVGRTSAFDKAKAHARRLVEALRAERPRDFLTASRTSRPDSPDVLLAPLATDRADGWLRQLDQAQPTPVTFDPPRALEACVRRLTDSNGPTQRVVYVLTDLRANDWLGASGERPRALGEALRAAPKDTRFLLVDVGSDDTRDLGVTLFEPTEKLAMVGLPLELVVHVANRGPHPVFDVPLVLEAGDARVPLPPIARIEAGQEAVVRHRYAFTKAGVSALAVKLPDDALPLDDARHLALEVREALRVLLIEGEEGARPIDAETRRLALALAPPGEVESGVEPVVVTPDALRDVDLSTFDSVIACNLEAWPRERVPELLKWVERGGGLGVFLGDLVDVAAWERDLAPLLPCKLGERVESPSEDEAPGLVAPLPDHPLAAVFAGERNPFLKRVRARVRRTLPGAREGASRVVLHLADGAETPFIVEKTVGDGRVLLFNTTADAAWSTWPRDPSYPVTVQELVRLLAPAATAGRNVLAGTPIERALNPARFWPRAYVSAPGAEAPAEVLPAPRPGSTALWVRVADTRRQGIWTIQLEPRDAEPVKDLVAVGVDPTEGELARADGARLLPALDGVQLRIVPGAEGADLLALSDGSKRELWRPLLLALVLVLALEQVLAWRAAHHRTDAEVKAEADAEALLAARLTATQGAA